MNRTTPTGEAHEIGKLDPDDFGARLMLNEIREHMFGRRDGLEFGRFEVKAHLGRGAHGNVYLAADSELQREVALKLLSADASVPSARARLLREAQALARLKHPNVMTIHDVGVEAGRVFIAMEYVEAGTLAQWCRNQPPGTRARFAEVLRLAIATGRGLSAAHNAGIVHRDVKPANILVGADGRPRIADFGLARAVAAETEVVSKESERGREMSPEAKLTATGDVVGTPAYMAPEQFVGQGDMASDQWSLCAALWECAYGQLPFERRRGERPREDREQPRPPRERIEVPRWWCDILSRGLRHDPQARWPSVATLVSELESAASRRRRRMWTLALGALPVVAAAGFGGWQLDLERRRSRCERDAESISVVWDDNARDRLREELLRSGVAYAQTSFTHATQHLDAYAEDWRRRLSELCVAAEVDGTHGPERWAAARGCLEERREEFASLLSVLTETPDSTAVSRTVTAAAGLRRLEPCSDDTWLDRHPKTQVDAATANLQRRLQRARALETIGAYAPGRALALELLEETADHASARLRAQILLRAGHLSHLAGYAGEARDQLADAFDEAIGASEDELAFDAAAMLAFVVGDALAKRGEGLLWGRVAEGLGHRIGDDTDLAAARLHQSIGHVHARHAQNSDAEREYAKALAIFEAVLGDGHPDVARVLGNLSLVHRAEGRYAEAERAQRTALTILEQALGPDHPRIANSYNNLGGVHQAMGQFAEAEAEYAKALSIRMSALRPDHPHIALSHIYLGNLFHVQGRFAEAERAVEQGCSIAERTLGPEDELVADAQHTLGKIYNAQGRYDESVEAFATALTIYEKALGPEHPRAAGTLASLGTGYYFAGRNEDAMEALTGALTKLEAARGRDHPDVGVVLSSLGDAYFTSERDDEAEQAYRRALQIFEKSLGPKHPSAAGSHLRLAELALRSGRYADAERGFAHSIMLREEALGLNSPKLATSLQGRAKALRMLDRPADAIAHAERAVTIIEKAGAGELDLADAKLELARALWAAHADRRRARALAEEARDAYQGAGPVRPEQSNAINQWLAQHRIR